MCNHPDPALCEQLGEHIHGRLWELWTGICPPERPCTKEAVTAFRRGYQDSSEHTEIRTTPCIHLGEPTREKVLCDS